MQFKRCPRCVGNLYEDRDGYGPYISCIQCGFLKDLSDDLPKESIDEMYPLVLAPARSKWADDTRNP